VTAAAEQPLEAAGAGVEAFIDVDVHESLGDPTNDLRPYVAQPFRDWLNSGPIRVPMIRYLHPARLVREEAVEERDGTATVLFGLNAPAALSNVGLLRETLLDRFQPKRTILTGRFYPSTLRLQPEVATALASAYNDWLVEHWLERDARLLGSVHVAAQDIEGAVREIDRMAAHPQMVQVLLPLAGWRWAKPEYRPLFDAVERTGLRVAFHTAGGVTTPTMGDPPTLLEWEATVHQNHMSQLSSLIFHGTFQRYPNLRVLFLECGFAWVPSLLGRMDYNYQSARAEVPWVKRLPSEYVKEHCVFGTQPLDPPDVQELLRAIEMLEADHLLVYASNYPQFDCDLPTHELLAQLPDGLRRQIMFENAARFYGVEAGA
jgi:predicted TIM-barrel fold metal-dependent hydrolase